VNPFNIEVLFMNIFRVTGATAILSVLAAGTAFAQTPSPPASTSTPSSASSPSQREATSSSAKESPASAPSDAATAHQREAMGGKQTMKQCMDAQSASNPSKSKSDMTKACEDHMKKQSPTTAAPK
jgi:hypothetical protein